MSHVSGMDLCSDMWSKFETLYRDTGFMERDAIFIRLSSQTASDFSTVAQFADSLKRDCYTLEGNRHKRRTRMDVLLRGYFTALTPSITPFA